MKLLLSAVALGLVLAGAIYLAVVYFGDPILRLQVRAVANPALLSGQGTIIKLPDSAAPETVVRSAFPGCMIEETRKLDADKTGVLIESMKGEKIVLLRYEENLGWLVMTRDPD